MSDGVRFAQCLDRELAHVLPSVFSPLLSDLYVFDPEMVQGSVDGM